MDNLSRAQRDWETPPDEPEAVYCEDCGEELSEIHTGIGSYRHTEYVCTNNFCPEKFAGVPKEMAELIVEQKDTIQRLENRIKFLTHKVEALEFRRDEGE